MTPPISSDQTRRDSSDQIPPKNSHFHIPIVVRGFIPYEKLNKTTIALPKKSTTISHISEPWKWTLGPNL